MLRLIELVMVDGCKIKEKGLVYKNSDKMFKKIDMHIYDTIYNKSYNTEK